MVISPHFVQSDLTVGLHAYIDVADGFTIGCATNTSLKTEICLCLLLGLVSCHQSVKGVLHPFSGDFDLSVLVFRFLVVGS